MDARRALVVAVVLSGGVVHGLGAADMTPDGLPAAPVAREHRYRLAAAIRPFFIWMGAKNVGGARIVWRQDGEGRKGYELLLGSDPARAPRRINRWGWFKVEGVLDGDETL